MKNINQDSRYEHLDVAEDGRVKGYYKVDASEARGIGTHDYWGRIEQIIQEYTRLHPIEITDCLKHASMSRDAAYNAYGLNIEDKQSTMRNGIAIPNGLIIAIMTFDPEFLENKGQKLNEFRRRFPGFNTSKRI